MSYVSLSEKSLALLRSMPRISLDNLSKLPTVKKPKMRGHGRKKGFEHGCGHKKNKARQRWPPLGWEAGNFAIQDTTPVEMSYNIGFHAQRQYPPLSLKTLQLMIDTERLDPSKPIDLAAICNTKLLTIDVDKRHFGVNLTDEGADCFEAKVNLEVQWASEQTIAAVEARGGRITTAYYDIFSIKAMVDPVNFFRQGKPIPRRLTPPQDAIAYYTDPRNRGYLSDPAQVAKERLVLSQKYGYELHDLEEEADSELKKMLEETKDPRQVFYGLHPGWIVNLKDKLIYKPNDKGLEKFYRDEWQELKKEQQKIEQQVD